jgi:glyoxylase I family protein
MLRSTLIAFALPLLAAEPALDLLKPGIDVGILVTDAAKARDFYTGVLGLKPTPSIKMPDGSEMIRLQAGASIVKIRTAAPNAPKSAGPVRDAIGMRMVTFVTTDAAPLEARMKEPSLPALKWNEGPGVKYAFLPDPDGNVIEVMQTADTARADQMQLAFAVADAEKTRAFYRDILGLKELPKMDRPDGALYLFEAGKSLIKFWQAPAGTAAKTGNPNTMSGLRYYTYMVKDVDATHAELVKRGAKIAMPPTDFGNIARIMFVADPDGNWIECAGMKARP